MTIPFSNRTVLSSIVILSAGIILYLFWLIYLREPAPEENSLDLSFLPAVNALLNSMSASCLILGYLAIRKGNQTRHIKMMVSALTFSFLFLISYLTYHTFHGDTLFQGEGWIRPLYFFILISHISLSAVVLPLVLTTVYYAATGNFNQHPKIARVTLPLWLYVSVTGVLVYLMLYHL
jgi:putative membrane protein